MPYMLLVLEPPGQRDTRTLPEGHEVYDRMVQFGENLKARGIVKAYDSLGSPATGARVTVRNGKRSLVDGPFAEAKEIVGGYALVVAPDRAAALAIAARCPHATWGEVEVRELLKVPAM